MKNAIYFYSVDTPYFWQMAPPVSRYVGANIHTVRVQNVTILGQILPSSTHIYPTQRGILGWDVHVPTERFSCHFKHGGAMRQGVR
jgi:hypothetical protein